MKITIRAQVTLDADLNNYVNDLRLALESRGLKVYEPLGRSDIFVIEIPAAKPKHLQ